MAICLTAILLGWWWAVAVKIIFLLRTPSLVLDLSRLPSPGRLSLLPTPPFLVYELTVDAH